MRNEPIGTADINSGREKGGVSMKYFMTVAGRDYPMTEHKYLTIPVGEFMEIHLAPHSKTVVRERWLKQDEKNRRSRNPKLKDFENGKRFEREVGNKSNGSKRKC